MSEDTMSIATFHSRKEAREWVKKYRTRLSAYKLIEIVNTDLVVVKYLSSPPLEVPSAAETE